MLHHQLLAMRSVTTKLWQLSCAVLTRRNGTCMNKESAVTTTSEDVHAAPAQPAHHVGGPKQLVPPVQRQQQRHSMGTRSRADFAHRSPSKVHSLQVAPCSRRSSATSG